MASASEDQTKPPQKSTPSLSEPVYTQPMHTQEYYGYPPQYPPYPPQYPAYPNQGYITAPPPAAYYYPPNHIQSQPHVRSSSIGFFTLAMMLFAFLGLTTLLLSGSDIPDFFVQSLSVPSFNVTDDALLANWDANITVKKHDDKLDMLFDRIEGIIFSYNDNNALGASQDQHFDMGTRNEAVFNMKLSTSNLQKDSGGGIYKELVQEKGKGVVSFSLSMRALVTYKSGTLWVRHAKFKVLCENLEVRFAGPTGPGNLVENKDQHRCILYGNRMYADD